MSYFRSLRERILLAGYDTVDIQFIGMHNIPGSNVDKPLTEDGTPYYDAYMRHTLTPFLSLETYKDKG